VIRFRLIALTVAGLASVSLSTSAAAVPPTVESLAALQQDPGFAGMWLDGDQLRVRMTGPAGRVVVGGAVVEVLPATRTAAQLSALGSRTFTELGNPATALGAEISYTGAVPSTNRVEIGIVNYTPALAKAIIARYGADAVSVVPAQPAVQTKLVVPKSRARLINPGVTTMDSVGACTRVYCTPTRGGVYMEQDQGNGFVGLCSATAVGTSRAGRNSTLTAGHCFTTGNPVFYGTTTPDIGGAQLGNPGDRLFGRDSDHLVIPWRTASGAGADRLTNCIFYTNGDNCHRINFNASSTSDIVQGAAVTQSGSTTGTHNGVVQIPSMNVRIGDNNGGFTDVTDFVGTSVCSLPGDSGGAVVVRNDRLLGTISAGNFGRDGNGNPVCNAAPRTWAPKATAAYYNLGWLPRLSP
jgi:hypothetical protein